jgi:hypothetical protein
MVREIEILKREVRDKDKLISDLEDKILNESQKNDEESSNEKKELIVLSAVIIYFCNVNYILNIDHLNPHLF